MDTLSNRIRKALNYAGLSQAELSERINVSESTVSQWLSGETKTIKSSNASKVARACGVNLNWIATGEGSMLGKQTSPNSLENSPDFRKLAHLYFKSDSRGRETILSIAQIEADRNKDLGLPPPKTGEMPESAYDIAAKSNVLHQKTRAFRKKK
jgi:transcriptional regulator with XRE-family HTH domain